MNKKALLQTANSLGQGNMPNSAIVERLGSLGRDVNGGNLDLLSTTCYSSPA